MEACVLLKMGKSHSDTNIPKPTALVRDAVEKLLAVSFVHYKTTRVFQGCGVQLDLNFRVAFKMNTNRTFTASTKRVSCSVRKSSSVAFMLELSLSCAYFTKLWCKVKASWLLCLRSVKAGWKCGESDIEKWWKLNAVKEVLGCTIKTVNLQWKYKVSTVKKQQVWRWKNTTRREKTANAREMYMKVYFRQYNYVEVHFRAAPNCRFHPANALTPPSAC